MQRRLPWESTLQASLTLALANPVLWFMVDRTKPGFALAAVVGILGTAILLGLKPDVVPPSAMPTDAGATASASLDLQRLTSYEGIGVMTWVASVLFCSSVCFGNVGRRLGQGS